ADTVPPSAPSNLTGTTSGTSQINLTWTASTDNVAVTGYTIEACQGVGCSTFAQIGTSTAASYSHTGLSDGTSYSYRVRATDAAANLSSYSNTASAVTNVLPPTAPSNLTATAAGATQVNLSWTASTSSIGISNYLVEHCHVKRSWAASTDNVCVTRYNIETCQGAGFCSFAQVVPSTAASYSNTGLLPATSYSYRVLATDAAGNLSSYSNITSTLTDASPT